jgi:two-component system sensor histidine kinase/response regulator
VGKNEDIIKKTSVLYVDDEENNLSSFRAYFRKEYEVYATTNVADAFTILENNPIHIIISDQRMPLITGIEFLEKTIEKSPDSMRLLITAYSDIDIVVEAINRGQISKYIQKPWDWEKLSLAIENCVLTYKSKIELKQKNNQLQKANDELNKFVYRVSHDLRAPLMSILGIIQLSETNEKSKTIENHFQIIKTCVLKLDTFIKNIIDYYKNSHPEEIRGTIDFKTLVLNIYDSLKHLDQRVIFKSEIEQTKEFIGDSFRIEVILKNLISNAIKYQNPNNKNPLLQVQIVSNKKEVCITVSDNGIGIAPEHLEKIFNMFFRIGTSANKEGTGIGLYIVKEAVEKMNGSITVESTPFVGTSFNITIPAISTEDQ